MAATVGLSAYWTALASRPSETPAPVPTPHPVPGLIPIASAPHQPSSITARDRAYRRGRRAGFREGRRAAERTLRRRLGGFPRWDGAYVVLGTRDGRGIHSRVGPLKPGERYELCRDGRAVCVKKPG
ncbi:MAG TPA: hypothetical protein VGF21_08755 [Thermoleophilaceae bacterium]|jgi:hypothetical protein